MLCSCEEAIHQRPDLFCAFIQTLCVHLEQVSELKLLYTTNITKIKYTFMAMAMETYDRFHVIFLKMN
jgi:hypothetical protein